MQEIIYIDQDEGSADLEYKYCIENMKTVKSLPVCGAEVHISPTFHLHDQATKIHKN